MQLRKHMLGKKYALGSKRSFKTRLLMSRAMLGNINAGIGKCNKSWKGGISKGTEYKTIRIINKNKNKNRLIKIHRYKMEKKLGRRLKDSEIVHHIDLNKNNNSIENLLLIKNKNEHSKFHKKLEILGSYIYMNLNEKNKKEFLHAKTS